MKRNSFLKFCLAAGTLLTASVSGLAKTKHKERIDKGVLVRAGKDRFDKPISLFQGDIFNAKVTTADSGGDIYVFESTREKEGGPALHLHFEQDEFWYVLKGEFLFKVGEETFTTKAGDSVFGPRNVPHAFAKVGKGEAKLLMFHQPAGKIEKMFKDISEGATKNMTTDEEKNNFFLLYDLKRVGPPLTYSKW